MKAESWEQALTEAMSSRVDNVPKEWITKRQFAKLLGRDEATAGRHMQILVGAGKAETKSFRIHAGSRILPVSHFRLKK